MKKKYFSLSKNEQEVMLLLWKEGRPLSRSEIIGLSPDRSWKSSSIHILLNSLLSKGAIQEHGYVKSATNIGRAFAPTLTENDYVALQIANTNTKIKLKIPYIVSALIDMQVDDNLVDDLKKMLDEKRAK